ncbi:hypothetical protein llap_7551 [Limosa lapponica baueri]|uniref:Uncharacterized protein n=1 Tax=Limosa lapponica baueri TaxID=1758121 RepID=A0A2I0U7S4_LIMLA|nr:hypothetical protein llap_7551 [Limosa lapponica baueri]
MSLASSHTDHILGLVAGAQKDYSQSLKLPKRPCTAERQEPFPGSRKDTSARTSTSSAAGLALSSPSSAVHLQVRFLGAKKIDRRYTLRSNSKNGHAIESLSNMQKYKCHAQKKGPGNYAHHGLKLMPVQDLFCAIGNLSDTVSFLIPD